MRIHEGIAQEGQHRVCSVGVGVEGDEVGEGDGGGDVSTRRSSHTIGKDQQVRAGITRILIVRTDKAHIGAGRCVEFDRWRRHVTSPVRGSSARCE